MASLGNEVLSWASYPAASGCHKSFKGPGSGSGVVIGSWWTGLWVGWSIDRGVTEIGVKASGAGEANKLICCCLSPGFTFLRLFCDFLGLFKSFFLLGDFGGLVEAWGLVLG